MIRWNSIPARFTALAMLFVLIVSALAGVIGGKLSLNYTGARFHKNFHVLAQYLAKNAELGLLLKDEIMLNNLAQNMLVLDDIYSVTVMDAGGNILVNTGQDKKSDRLVTIETEVMRSEQEEEDRLFLNPQQQKKNLGKVVMTYSRKSLEDLQNRMILYFSGLMLFFVVLSWFCFRFLSRSVALPLQEIVRVSRAVSHGNLNVRAGTRGPGSGLSEVRTLAAGFNNMLDALQQEKQKAKAAYEEMGRQQTLAEVGKFSMMVAHEVKNPLTVMKGSLALLKKDTLAANTKQELITYLEDDIQRINKVVEDFLVFARPKQPDLGPVDPNRFVAEAVEKFFYVTNEIVVETSIDTIPVTVHCDRALMERALINILKNAVAFATRTIIVKTLAADGKWRLSVMDDGPGLPENGDEDIFTPFFTTRSRGTGLGLSITRDIVELHGGEIQANNRESGGACFEIVMECA